MEICKVCNNPQPPDDEMTLHYDWCKYHNISTCMACKELLENEEYEELAKVLIVEPSQGVKIECQKHKE